MKIQNSFFFKITKLIFAAVLNKAAFLVGLNEIISLSLVALQKIQHEKIENYGITHKRGKYPSNFVHVSFYVHFMIIGTIMLYSKSFFVFIIPLYV